jgi:signal peptidase II
MWIFPLVASSVVILDQVSKLSIRICMSQGQSIPQEGFFRITYSTNSGGVFGLPAPQAFLITLSVIVVALIIVAYCRYPLARKILIQMALGLLMGGAIGNLIDRLFIGEFGKVVDFIDIGAWPVFNLADLSIVIGVAVVAYYFLVIARKEQPKLNEHE